MSDEPAAVPSNESLRMFLAGVDVPCPRCDYNLRGVDQARCPECGEPLRLECVGSTVRPAAALAMLPAAFVVGASGVMLLLAVIQTLAWLVQSPGRVRVRLDLDTEQLPVVVGCLVVSIAWLVSMARVRPREGRVRPAGWGSVVCACLGVSLVFAALLALTG